MLDYQFRRFEPGMFTEIYLPKKTYFQGKLYDTLTDGFDVEKLKKHFNSKKEKIERVLRFFRPRYARDYNQMVSELEPVLFGYSMYEVDGVFKSRKGQGTTEERTQVIRLMLKPDFKKVYDVCEDTCSQTKLNFVKKYLDIDSDSEDDFQESVRVFVAHYLQFPPTPTSFQRYIASIAGDEEMGVLEKRVISYLGKWVDDIGFFLFGYIIFEICHQISELLEEKKITSKQIEEEIWVATFWDLTINQIDLTGLID